MIEVKWDEYGSPILYREDDIIGKLDDAYSAHNAIEFTFLIAHNHEYYIVYPHPSEKNSWCKNISHIFTLSIVILILNGLNMPYTYLGVLDE